jgi:glycosyltransferase involved in cell wall biosynthesis
MKILWLAWKDVQHPGAGGAEVVLWELSRRLIRDGHTVTVLTCGYPGAAAADTIDGVRVIRVGTSRYLHPFQATWYYLRYLRYDFDIMIETVNTATYLAALFAGSAKRYLLYHQLAREIWFYETKPPLSWLGYYLLEPLATWLLGNADLPTITVSESTKRDLVRFGFNPAKISTMSEGIEFAPLESLDAVEKFPQPTLLSHGTMRAMKNTLDQVKAFEIAKRSIPDLQLKISGSTTGGYAQQVLAYIDKSPFKADIEVLGRTTEVEKINLMRRCHLKLQTAIKEGWGITITEANSQGAPAVVYDADGLRDSVQDGKIGLVTARTPQALAVGITTLLQDQSLYNKMQVAAWEWSKTITFDHAYHDFKSVLELS